MPDDLEFALNQLADANLLLRSLNLTNFSDLSRVQCDEFFSIWDDLPQERQRELMEVMVEQAEANIHLNFRAIFRRLLADASPQVRRLAIEGLWEDERPGLATRLISLLAEDSDPDVRAVAASSLGRFVLLGVLGDIESTLAGSVEQALRAAWARPNETVDVRRRALEGLAYSEDSQVRNLIEVAYYDEDDTMRQSAVFAMGRTADPFWGKHVMTELHSDSAPMRFEAAVSAGELRLTPAVRTLVAMMDDRDGNVREVAALALGKIGGSEAQRALRAAARSEEVRLADAANEALEELAFNGGSADEALLLTFPVPGGRASDSEWTDESDDADDLDEDEFAEVRLDDVAGEDDGWDDDDEEGLLWVDDEETLDDWDDFDGEDI